MEVLVDDNLVDGGFAGSGTVEEALRHVQANLCAPGRVVIGLRCDGQEVSSDAMGDALQKPASSFERLEVLTGARQSLVIDAMEQASACLIETDATCERVAALLTEGKTVEAIEALGECLRIWQQIHEAVAKSIEMLQLDPEQLTINNKPLTELIGKPKDILLQVKGALQAQDYVMLADILQYEFREVTDQWQAIAGKLREEAQASAPEHP